MGSQRKSQKVTRQYGQLGLRTESHRNRLSSHSLSHLLLGEKRGGDLNKTKALSHTLSHLMTSSPTYTITSQMRKLRFREAVTQVLTAKGLSLNLKSYPLIPNPIPLLFTKRPQTDAPNLTARAKEKSRSKAPPSLPPPL